MAVALERLVLRGARIRAQPCAYTTEMLAGAIGTTPHGEVEAARAFGHVVGNADAPHRAAFGTAPLPAGLQQRSHPDAAATSIASVVTLLDLTGAAREMNSRFYLPFEAFVTAALFYLALTFVLVALFRRAEARWLVHLNGHLNAHPRPRH